MPALIPDLESLTQLGAQEDQKSVTLGLDPARAPSGRPEPKVQGRKHLPHDRIAQLKRRIRQRHRRGTKRLAVKVVAHRIDRPVAQPLPRGRVAGPKAAPGTGIKQKAQDARHAAGLEHG